MASVALPSIQPKASIRKMITTKSVLVISIAFNLLIIYFLPANPDFLFRHSWLDMAQRDSKQHIAGHASPPPASGKKFSPARNA